LQRPYLNKFSNSEVLVNAVWVGHSEPIEIIGDEGEAFIKASHDQYSNFIISCGVSDGVSMLRRIRTDQASNKIPITIL